jgi:Rps23 Pro-64 3,4-dihydroxylase Tpa1-like proline 4-hydroxylase
VFCIVTKFELLNDLGEAKMRNNLIFEMKSKLERANIIETPFKHFVVDNFIPSSMLIGISSAFNDYRSWEESVESDIEVKGRSTWESHYDIPDSLVAIVQFLTSSVFLMAVSRLFCIPRLLSDPYYGGGGMNRSDESGVLDVHVDGNFSDQTGLHRRLNAILYLSDTWEAGWGGHLGLYDTTGKALIREYSPLFNRLVVFETTDYGFHGISSKISCPKGFYRDSLLLYYYTATPRPAKDTVVNNPHSALWIKRGYVDKRGNRERK